ncbi:Putative LOC100902024, partial [Caligus rogercresseyi]
SSGSQGEILLHELRHPVQTMAEASDMDKIGEHVLQSSASLETVRDGIGEQKTNFAVVMVLSKELE